MSEETRNVEPVEENPASQMKWYTLQVFTSQEEKVKGFIDLEVGRQNLGEQIGEVHVPVQNSFEVRGGKKKVVSKVQYPGYIFIQMQINRVTQHFIRNVPSVMGFVGPDGKPIPLTDAEVMRVVGKSNTGENIPEYRYQVGDKVKVIDGAFVDFEGTIQEVTQDRKRLKVLVSIFGRSTPLDLSMSQVEAIEEEES